MFDSMNSILFNSRKRFALFSLKVIPAKQENNYWEQGRKMYADRNVSNTNHIF